MKKTSLKYWFAMLLILLAASFFVASCKAKKTNVTEETNTKDSSRYELHSDYKKEVNKKVADSIAKLIPLIKTGDKNCDSICNEKCDELLEQANFYKQSGDNNYKLLFDKHTRLLSFTANLEETFSELKEKSEKKDRIFTKTKTITITKKVTYIPWWVKYLAWIGGIIISFYTIKYGIKIYKIVVP